MAPSKFGYGICFLIVVSISSAFRHSSTGETVAVSGKSATFSQSKSADRLNAGRSLSSISPMESSPFRACLDGIALLEDSKDGYAFFQPKASTADAPWVNGEQMSMLSCIKKGFCEYPSIKELTTGTMFKSNWKTSDVVSACFSDYRTAANATLYTLGNVHKGVQLIPFLGGIMSMVREGGRETARRSGAKGAGLAHREAAAVAGSTWDLQNGIVKEVNDCLQQLEMERIQLKLLDMGKDIPISADAGGEDLLEHNMGTFCDSSSDLSFDRW